MKWLPWAEFVVDLAIVVMLAYVLVALLFKFVLDQVFF